MTILNTTKIISTLLYNLDVILSVLFLACRSNSVREYVST